MQLIYYIYCAFCESGSMVEHCLPKATVASSNLVFRSKGLIINVVLIKPL